MVSRPTEPTINTARAGLTRSRSQIQAAAGMARAAASTSKPKGYQPTCSPRPARPGWFSSAAAETSIPSNRSYDDNIVNFATAQIN